LYTGCLVTFISVPQDLIPEAISDQNCHTKMDLILSSYVDMWIWNAVWYGTLFIYCKKDCTVQITVVMIVGW